MHIQSKFHVDTPTDRQIACLVEHVLGSQLAQICYYNTTYTVSSSLCSHIPAAQGRLSAQHLQVWMKELEQDGPPTLASNS